jgi:uncharacterized protein
LRVAINGGVAMDNNPVVHFEMPYEDAKRLEEFYEKAFGWRMKTFGEDVGGYVTAETTKTENGRPVTPGAINGGFFAKKPDSAQCPSVVIGVADIKVAMKSVAAAGGKILGEPVDIPGVGEYVSFTDTEGNRASLLHPKI